MTSKKCNATQYCTSKILGCSGKFILFSCFNYSYHGEKWIGKTCQSLLAPNILFIYRIWSTPSVFHGQWEILGVCVLLSRWCDNFGAASSSQTDIYKESEVFTAAIAVGALDSWESRTGDHCLSHRITCRRKSIRQLQSPLPVLWRSQHFLRPKKKLKTDEWKSS